MQDTKVERLAGDKQSNLLQRFVNNGQKKFYNIGPRTLKWLGLQKSETKFNPTIFYKIDSYPVMNVFYL